MMETYPGAHAGFRAMALKTEGLGPTIMTSVAKMWHGSQYAWRADETNTATCGRGGDHGGRRIPVFECECGFWCYKNISQLKERLYTVENSVYVLMAGWGKVTEYTVGFRCEFARPIAAITPLPERSWRNVPEKRALKIVKNTGLPIVTLAEVPMLIEEYELDPLPIVEYRPMAQYVAMNGSVDFLPVAANPRNSVMLPPPSETPSDTIGVDFAERRVVEGPIPVDHRDPLEKLLDPEVPLMRMHKALWVGGQGEYKAFWIPDSYSEARAAAVMERGARQPNGERFRVVG